MSDYGFFWDSKNGDRKYNASSFEEWLKRFFTTGVFNGELQVTSTGGMNISVAAGYANVNGKVMLFDTHAFQLEMSFIALPRVDTVVVERNDNTRAITLKVVKGGTDGTATPPVRQNGVYQLVLAQIAIPAAATSITQSSITDTRMNSSLCGWVASTVSEINFDQAYAQFTAWFNEYKEEIVGDFSEAGRMAQAIFDDWFQHMKDQLDTDAAGHLQYEVDETNKNVDKIEADNDLESSVITFNSDGSITETFTNKVKTTVFNSDGSITEILTNSTTAERYYRRITRFMPNGTITKEVQ